MSEETVTNEQTNTNEQTKTALEVLLADYQKQLTDSTTQLKNIANARQHLNQQESQVHQKAAQLEGAVYATKEALKLLSGKGEENVEEKK